mmetsp:Transcript_129288/g.228683  ORF Transcript_129288/g.228683 Transcript_129288/m.228683 type:complete len:183 (-) Transcript_129288:133-681(-)
MAAFGKTPIWPMVHPFDPSQREEQWKQRVHHEERCVYIHQKLRHRHNLNVQHWAMGKAAPPPWATEDDRDGDLRMLPDRQSNASSCLPSSCSAVTADLQFGRDWEGSVISSARGGAAREGDSSRLPPAKWPLNGSSRGHSSAARQASARGRHGPKATEVRSSRSAGAPHSGAWSARGARILK